MATSGRTEFNLLEKETSRITINGVTYTMAQYKKMLADKKKAAAKAEREKAKAEGRKIVRVKKVKQVKEIGIVSQKVQDLMKTMPTLKSIPNYRNHAYKAWGTIANEILAHYTISRPITSYCIQFRELNELVEQIEKLAKRNEKAAYQYVEKIIWKLDDMRTSINRLTKAIDESGVCVRFKNHESINGKGKNLGLATVVSKCGKTLTQMEGAMKQLEQIVTNGTDPFLYGSHMSINTRRRCMA